MNPQFRKDDNRNRKCPGLDGDLYGMLLLRFSEV